MLNYNRLFNARSEWIPYGLLASLRGMRLIMGDLTIDLDILSLVKNRCTCIGACFGASLKTTGFAESVANYPSSSIRVNSERHYMLVGRDHRLRLGEAKA